MKLLRVKERLMILKCLKMAKYIFLPDIKLFGDSGYQGIKDIHFNSRPSIKKREEVNKEAKAL